MRITPDLTSEQLAEIGQLHLARLLLLAYRAVQRVALQEQARRGFDDVRAGHIPVFTNIDPARGTRVGVLAEKSGMTRQGMAQVVADLERRGYVTAGQDPSDRRASIVRLTPRGEAFCESAGPAMRAVEAAYAESLGADTLATLRAALGELARS